MNGGKIIRKFLLTVFALVLIFAVDIDASSMPLSGKVILIDSGHGEWDPGKVGESKTLEKDINLSIAKKLQAYLELADAYVLMTRVEDKALGSNKDADMAGRKQIANTSSADVLISIHQNSFELGSAKGPQVFHHNESEPSKKLANTIQIEMNNMLERSPNRKAKINPTYFILRTTTMPAVIVECGFLTNSWDRDSLRQEAYQEKVAWAIYKGIINYFSEE